MVALLACCICLACSARLGPLVGNRRSVQKKGFASLMFGYISMSHVRLISQFKPALLSSTISKTSVRVSSGFQTRENTWNHEAAGRVVLLFSSVWKPDETRSTSFWNNFSNKKIRSSCNFHEFSQIFFLWIVINALRRWLRFRRWRASVWNYFCI